MIDIGIDNVIVYLDDEEHRMMVMIISFRHKLGKTSFDT